jgi:succinate dehydrogenase/fumarate reductase flavoprotein subunit
MIGIIWSFLTGNKIARTIGLAVMAVLGVLTFGAVKKREGAQQAKAKQAVEAAKAKEKTIEDVLRETPSDDPVDDIRERMRKRAKQP